MEGFSGAVAFDKIKQTCTGNMVLANTENYIIGKTLLADADYVFIQDEASIAFAHTLATASS
jgi:hypothetical protein